MLSLVGKAVRTLVEVVQILNSLRTPPNADSTSTMPDSTTSADQTPQSSHKVEIAAAPQAVELKEVPPLVAKTNASELSRRSRDDEDTVGDVPAPLIKKAAPKSTEKKPAKVQKPKTATSPKKNTIDALESLLNAHKNKAALLEAGRETKDQLLRALIPLYLAKDSSFSVSSGNMERFWKNHRVTLQAPNAAKAIRIYPGHTAKTNVGTQITPKGVAYVESAISKGKSSKMSN